MRAIWTLIAVFMAVTAGDAYTTWACLHDPVSWVFESNPMANWLFGFFGLLPGLVIDGAITLLILVWLGCTKRLWIWIKMVILIMGIAITVYAIHNNYQVMIEMGIA